MKKRHIVQINSVIGKKGKSETVNRQRGIKKETQYKCKQSFWQKRKERDRKTDIRQKSRKSHKQFKT